MKANSRIWFLPAALAALAAALGPPLRTLGTEYLFSAHMLQHLLLQLVAPALLLLSLPVTGEEAPRLRASGAVGMWVAGVGSMWVWHAPALCNAALQSPFLQVVQYATLLATGGLFWWPVVGPRREWRLPPLLGILYLFTACLGCTALGIVITFAPPEMYGKYFHAEAAPGIFRAWVTSPAADQRLGGLLMWVPACFIYIAGILGLLSRSYGEREREPLGTPVTH